jgi:hypothetical protein
MGVIIFMIIASIPVIGPAYASPVINAAPHRFNWLFHVTLYFNNDANQGFKEKCSCFNKVGGIQDNRPSRSFWQDANMVYTEEAGLRITLLNCWIISCANSVGT